MASSMAYVFPYMVEQACVLDAAYSIAYNTQQSKQAFGRRVWYALLYAVEQTGIQVPYIKMHTGTCQSSQVQTGHARFDITYFDHGTMHKGETQGTKKTKMTTTSQATSAGLVREVFKG